MMLSAEARSSHETAGVSRAYRGCGGGGMAARGTPATAVDARDRLSQRPVAGGHVASDHGIPARAGGKWLQRRSERGHRISLRGWPIRQVACDGSRTRATIGRGDHNNRWRAGRAGREGGDFEHSDHLHHGQRSGEARSRSELQPTGWEYDWNRTPDQSVGPQTPWAVARRSAQCEYSRVSRESELSRIRGPDIRYARCCG